MSKQEKLVEALNLWVSLTNFDEKKQSFNMREYDIKRMTDSIGEALELDDTNITCFLMLSYYAESFIRQTQFNLTDLLNDRPRVEDFVAKTEQLQRLLNDKEMLEDLAHFQLVTRQAVRHYQADTDEVMKLIDDRHDIALLRRDALASMKKLRVDYFTHGIPEAESVKPAYNRDVYQFWNINSMLRALCNSPSGVSLNLIRTPDDFQSYFVFAIRNGGHIITLSDIPEEAHPLAKYMSRRPDKEYGKRIMQNWFPYDLMNWVYNEESNTLWIEKQDFGNAVTPINQTAFPLSAIKELGACEIIWITLMFELIVERFWRKPVSAPQLSYTGEMVKVQSALIDQANEAGLPVVQYHGIEAKELTLQEVAHPGEDMKEALGKSGGNHNDWLIERYEAKVNPLMLNMLSTGDVVAYLTQEASEGTLPSVVTAKHYADKVDDFFNQKVRKYKYHSLDSASFGDKKQLLNDRLFLARANFATEIQRLADIEYEQRKGEIMQWFRDRIEDNADTLYALAIQETCYVQVEGPKRPRRLSGTYRPGKDVIRYRLSKLYDKSDYYKDISYVSYGVTLNSGWENSKAFCHRNGKVASWVLNVTPQTLDDLALITGVEVADMPDVLQHWVSDQDYSGNANLQRIDPVAWKLKNPWLQCNFAVNVWLSTSSLNAIRKTMKLPDAQKFYKDTTEDWNFPSDDPFSGM
ncbi:hypothetical protein [Pseudomonas amygdali]|uniref:Uncharacterized protein n=2 Tax=Pseudomonas amygdali pv. lachrymans TaxID=53707 RepID=A0ABR5KQA2_PSEAV|nr:hypothetical protein [Pseudomonas amygdali]AXH59560.1 hypothetical protein PLA107_030510 [Pseudomonas amygdali pv. lachrymans str. M301315]KPC16987.1 Uncharacterized protein AC499_0189 [Pseudomonas amygdali pv. lachrymans]KPC17946.1 Uncharacterized protein AC499_1148 [Pseudomonas amygdali pv. lachrymans]RMT06520.1 hypothetical protein ALP54_03482 [Pseudomonas amygdali pv. lachrymans]